MKVRTINEIIGQTLCEKYVHIDELSFDQKVTTNSSLQILSYVQVFEEPITIFSESDKATGFGYIRYLSNKTLKIHIVDQKQRLSFDQKDRFLITFTLFGDFFIFPVSSREIFHEKECEMLRINPVPELVYRVRRRVSDRVNLNVSEQILVELREKNGRRNFKMHIQNLSIKGLGLVSNDKNIFSRLIELDKEVYVKPHIPGLQRSEWLPAKVVHWKKIGELFIIGIDCELPLGFGEETYVEDFLLRKKYPNVIRANSQKDYILAWNILDEAYKHFTPVDQQKLNDVIISWLKTSWSRKPLHRVYLLQKNSQTSKTNKTLGTISASLFYSKTWLVHQLAVDGTQGQILSHQLYGRAFDYLKQTRNVKYITGIWPKGHRVFQKYYVDFIREDSSVNPHSLSETRVFHLDTQLALDSVQPLSKEIYSKECESLDDWSEIYNHLKTKFPVFVLDAMDITPVDFELRDVDELYMTVALDRKRKWLIFFEEDKLLAFSLIEWSSGSHSVFDLFNQFRIFFLADPHGYSDKVMKTVFGKILQVYADNNIKKTIFTDPIINPHNFLAGSEFFGEALLWIGSTKNTNGFLRHLDRLHGERKGDKLIARKKQRI